MFLCSRFVFTILSFASIFVIVKEADGIRSPQRAYPASGTEPAATIPERVSSLCQPYVPSSKDLCRSMNVEKNANAAHQACKDHCSLISDYIAELNKSFGGDSSDEKYLTACADLEDGKCEKRRSFGYQCKCVQKESQAKISAVRCKENVRKSNVFAKMEKAWRSAQQTTLEAEPGYKKKSGGGCFGSSKNFRSTSYQSRGRNYDHNYSFDRYGRFHRSYSSPPCPYYHHHHHHHHHHHPKIDVGVFGEEFECECCLGKDRCSQGCNFVCSRIIGCLICFFQED